jgi:hypothetical protein
MQRKGLDADGEMVAPEQRLRRRDTPVAAGGRDATADAAPDSADGGASGDGTVIDRLTAVHNGRLGRLLNQLQVLGVEKMHLDRIQSQLTSALGDDSGKKFRVLQQAIEQLVRDKTLGRDPAPAAPRGDDELKPADIERLAAKAKTVTTYVPDPRMHSLQQGDWKSVSEEGPNQRTPLSFQGDLAPVMVKGELVGMPQVVETTGERQAGRPMLGAAVMKDSYDYLGDTQIDLEDKTGRAASAAVPVVASSRPSDRKDDAKDPSKREHANGDGNRAPDVAQAQGVAESPGAEPKARRRKKKAIRQTFKQLNAALYHPHENSKGLEMRKRIGLQRGGPGRFEDAQQENGGTAPMPGTAFWQCMLVTSTDGRKAGSQGGHLIVPNLRLLIPPTVCLSDVHKGGRYYATLYTGEDGFVYRGSVGKDSAIDWISKMRRLFLKRMAALKAYVPDDDEPKWVLRKPNTDMPGHSARGILDDAGLRQAFSEANSMYVNLWQVYIRGQGAYSQICRIVHDFTGLSEESGHYMLSCTHEMGSKENFTGGYFVDSNDVQGTKAQGRSTIINKVLYSGWASHVETAVYLTSWAHSVFPYRRLPNGGMKQKLPKFSPKFLAMDFLVGRDGQWYFSNCLVLRSQRNPKAIESGEQSTLSETPIFGPDLTCTFLENNFVAVKRSLATDMTRRFGQSVRPESAEASSWRGEPAANTIQPLHTAESVPMDSAEESTASRVQSPLGRSKSSVGSVASQLSFSLSKKQTVMSEKEKQSFDPFNNIFDDLSESDGSKEEEGRKSDLMAMTSALSQVGVTRRMPRPKTAEPTFTGRLTLDKVNNLASNPRMQASGSRVLKEILVARSRAQSAGLKEEDDAPSKVWGVLKRRISAVALSDPRAKNPIHDPVLLMRLGTSTENVFTDQDVSAPGTERATVRRSKMPMIVLIRVGLC